MDGCTFCDIIAGDEPAFVVSRDDDAIAFLDIFPAVPGHTLVAPIDHQAGLLDMTDDETAALFGSVRRVTGAVVDAVDADGVSIFQSSGAAAGQDVFHVHVHVVPRYQDDDITFAPPRERLTKAEGERVSSAIQASFANE